MALITPNQEALTRAKYSDALKKLADDSKTAFAADPEDRTGFAPSDKPYTAFEDFKKSKEAPATPAPADPAPKTP